MVCVCVSLAHCERVPQILWIALNILCVNQFKYILATRNVCMMVDSIGMRHESFVSLCDCLACMIAYTLTRMHFKNVSLSIAVPFVFSHLARSSFYPSVAAAGFPTNTTTTTTMAMAMMTKTTTTYLNAEQAKVQNSHAHIDTYTLCIWGMLRCGVMRQIHEANSYHKHNFLCFDDFGL